MPAPPSGEAVALLLGLAAVFEEGDGDGDEEEEWWWEREVKKEESFSPTRLAPVSKEDQAVFKCSPVFSMLFSKSAQPLC